MSDPRATPCRVKICGLRTHEAMQAALQAGADLVGLVFFPKSPRNVDLDTARALADQARGKAEVVALLVDPSDGLVSDVVRRVQPDRIQLHGHETIERVRAVRALAGLPVMKAVSVAEPADVEAALAYLDPVAGADIVLFDAKPPRDPGALPGGNGLSFDWRILAPLRGRIPFALAGGLTPENAASARDLTGAAMLDVSSGVETAPGQKSADLIRRFLRAAKTANQAD